MYRPVLNEYYVIKETLFQQIFTVLAEIIYMFGYHEAFSVG